MLIRSRSIDLFCALVGVGALAVMAIQAHGSPIFGLDFSQMRTGAINLLHHGDPYLRTHNQPFVYPPAAAAVATPLIGVSAVVADDLGLLIVAVSLAVLAFVSGRFAGHRWRFGAAVLVIISISGVGRGSLALVTLSALVAAALAFSLALAGDERWIEAAVVFGVAVAIKPLIAPAVLVFAVARRWRAAAVAVAVPLGLNLLTLPLLRHPTDFVTTTLPTVLRGQTLRSVYSSSISAVVGGDGRVAVIVLKALVILAVAAVLIGAARRPDRTALAAVAAVSILTVALLGRVDENHYTLVAVPLMAIAAVRPGVTRLVALVSVAFLALPGSAIPGASTLGRDWTLLGQMLVLLTALVATAGASRSTPVIVGRARQRRTEAPRLSLPSGPRREPQRQRSGQPAP